MKCTFTGYRSGVSYKNDPNGRQYLMIGILYNDPSWEGIHAESKMVPSSFLPIVRDLKPNSTINIDEFNRQIMDISPVK